DVMTQTPTTIPRTADIETALVNMRKAGARRLPIVDESGRITGIVTSFDLVRLLASELSELGRSLEEGVDPPDLPSGRLAGNLLRRAQEVCALRGRRREPSARVPSPRGAALPARVRRVLRTDP